MTNQNNNFFFFKSSWPPETKTLLVYKELDKSPVISLKHFLKSAFEAFCWSS